MILELPGVCDVLVRVQIATCYKSFLKMRSATLCSGLREKTVSFDKNNRLFVQKTLTKYGVQPCAAI